MTNPTPIPDPAPVNPILPVIQDVEDFLHNFRNPQTDIDIASNLVSAFAAVGILDAPLTGWLQGVLAAAGALVVAVLQRPVTSKVARWAAARAARRAAARR